ncbi:unnamed protein product [Sphagnum balticum]
MKPDEGSKRKHSDDDDVHLLHLRHGKPTRETTAAWRETRRRWMLYMRLDTCLICNNFPCLVLSLRHHPFCHRHELPEEIEKTRERLPASPSKEFRRFVVT